MTAQDEIYEGLTQSKKTEKMIESFNEFKLKQDDEFCTVKDVKLILEIIIKLIRDKTL
jgi:hypothetical protein